MIEIQSQPSTWVSAYEPNVFSFYAYNSVGNVSLTDSLFTNNVIMDVTGKRNLFELGDRVRIDIGTIIYGFIIQFDGNDAILSTPRLLSSYAGVQCWVSLRNRAVMTLEVGNMATGIPYTQVAEFYAVQRERLYSVDLQGYLQDMYGNIGTPPVQGIDAPLFLNYRLNYKYLLGVLNNNAFFLTQIGTAKNSLNGCVQGLNTSTYITTPGTPLMQGTIVKHNSKSSLYSYIVGNQAISKLI